MRIIWPSWRRSGDREDTEGRMQMDSWDLILISGGKVQRDFALSFCEAAPGAKRAAADRGLAFFYETGLVPDWAVGDFDSCPPQALLWARKEGVPLRQLDTHKDDTDTRSALRMALEAECRRIALLGATGTRLDHSLANIQLLVWARQEGLCLEIFDAFNHLYLARSGMRISRKEAFGPYLSFLPLSGPVEGLCLSGFAYPLEGKSLSCLDAGLTVSNELSGEEGRVSFRSGDLLVIEARDEPRGL